MTRVFYADVTPLMNDTVFEAHLKNTPVFRQEKINRLKFRKDKNLSLGAWIVCSYALKQEGINLSDAGFEYDKSGKPYLKNLPDIHISLSHSESIALCAISDERVGLDAEFVSDFNEGICKRFFSKKERDYVLSCSDSALKRERFFRIWVLKESYVKFTGKGIGGFCDFDIDAESDEILMNNKYGICSCFFSELSIPGYKAAVCTVKKETPEVSRVNVIKELVNFDLT